VNTPHTADQPPLWLLCVCAFCGIASMRMTDAMLPLLVTAFDASTTRAAATISAFALTYGALQLVYGLLGDRFGKVRVIALATLACTVGNLTAAAAPNLDWLIASRALSGATAAGILPLVLAWVGDTVPFQARHLVLARVLAATTFGMICGQYAGGFLAEYLGWRIAFLCLGVAFIACGALLLRRAPPRHTQPASGGTYGLALRNVLIAAWPRRVLLLTALEGAFIYGALGFMPLYLHQHFHLSVSFAGALATLFGIGGILYTRCAAAMLQRLTQAQFALLGGCLCCISLTLIVLAPTWGLVAVACLTGGFGFFTLHNTLQLTATQMAPQARGTAMSLFACSYIAGQALGVSVAAWIADVLSIPTAFAIAAAGVLLVGLVFACFLKARRHPAP